ncbi:hypothetical protein [Demequina flava]|uniref:hypothetical protein n=1 Tax=Demequina flava TaxID=1095025 RepID=UPI00128BF7B9|nr:hypothetical protein [Demequina flava]
MSAPSNHTTTAARKWMQGIHDGLLSAGLVQTGDTGQINLATVTPTNPGSPTALGYEIWRFDDDVQATAPVFIKIVYGELYSSSQAKPWYSVAIATGSDGAGNLTGPVKASAKLSNSGSFSSNYKQTTTEYASYSSGDGSSVNIITWPAWQESQQPAGFSIMRSCGTDGNYNADAIAVMWYSPSDRGVYIVGATTGVEGASESAEYGVLGMTLPTKVNGVAMNTSNLLTATLSEDGTKAPVFPAPLAAPGVAPWVPNGIAVVMPGDAGATSVIQVATINGAARTLRAFPYTATSTYPGLAAQAAVGVSTNIVCLPAIAWAVE